MMGPSRDQQVDRTVYVTFNRAGCMVTALASRKVNHRTMISPGKASPVAITAPGSADAGKAGSVAGTTRHASVRGD